MSFDPNLDIISDELRSKFGCHTVILYGSRARGDATEASDYDVLGVRESGEIFRDARLWNGVYLDIFVFSESELLEPHDGMLEMRFGKILCQKGDFATQFFERLERIHKAGPKKLRADEINALLTWHEKALDRIRLGGIQGNLRRAELVPAILEHFFTTRGEWYRGPKASFQWLKENCSSIYDAFEAALEPAAPLSAFERLVSLVNAKIAQEEKPRAAATSGDVEKKVILSPIGYVKSSRTRAEDDNWDAVESSVELDATRFGPSSLQGLASFSHVEIIFYMNQVNPDKIEIEARHPRNNPNWPKVGIFAQRAKNRPNQLGSTICKIQRIEGTTIHLSGLDAIDRSPVLDIKPWVEEFGPRGKITQPTWMSELMTAYWSSPGLESKK